MSVLLRRFSLLACALWLLQACASSTPPPDGDQALIAPGHVLALPTPADFGRRTDVAQLVTVNWQDQTFAFEARISITQQQVVIAGIDGMGRRAMTITWNDSGISQHAASWLPRALQPGPMLVDIVVLYWPEDAVRRALAAAGATLTADASHRTVLIEGKPVLEAEYLFAPGAAWPNKVRYRNLAWGYSMEIESVESNG